MSNQPTKQIFTFVTCFLSKMDPPGPSFPFPLHPTCLVQVIAFFLVTCKDFLIILHTPISLSEDIYSSLGRLKTSVLPKAFGKFACTINHKFLTSPKVFPVHHQFVLNPEFSSFTLFPHWMTSSSESHFRATSPAF